LPQPGITHITADGVYKIVLAYSGKLGFEIGVHSLLATAATNALDHQADIQCELLSLY
jgi:integrase/recombinase XerD